jgi:CRP-like cAMP-binding protein
MKLLQGYFMSEGIPETEAANIATLFTLRKLKKGELFMEEGKTARQLGLVQKGFFQYYINLDGEEKTTYYVGIRNFVVSLVSFLKQEPARENIRAVAESEVWVIERRALQELLKSSPSFNKFYTGVLEWQICCIDESRLDALMLNAQQRYEKMMEKEPTLIQQIPMHYLASILGVTPRHLSRIRNNIR